MGNKRFLKVFTILLISTAFIFSFSHFGALAIENGFGHKEKYAQGTAAGGIELSGLTEEQARQKLSAAVQKWKASNSAEIVYLSKTVKLPAGLLHFSVTESMLRVKNGQASSLVVTLDNNGLRNLVSKSFPDVSPDDVDISRLDKAICHAAARLETTNLSFDLSGYALDGSEKETTVSKGSVSNVSIAEATELENWAKQFPEVNIPAHGMFSLLKTAEKTGASFSNEALSIVATAVYGAVLPTNFEIIERNTGNELPYYAALGKEAKVVKGKLDFSFVNPNPTAYQLKFTVHNGVFSVSVAGRPFLENYKMVLKDKKTIHPETTVQFQAALKTDQSVVVQAGKAGYYARVFRNIYSRNHGLLKSVLLAEDFYPPVAQRVAKGNPVQTENTDGSSETDNGSGNETDTPTSGGNSESSGKSAGAEAAKSSGKNADAEASKKNGKSSSTKAGTSNDSKDSTGTHDGKDNGADSKS
ncbi:VanW family protein [Weizmannia sp. FSL W8-1119]|uniref:VanW family protein n=1 Tax=Weizmannia sp. FSL W8-1119 TaxID=2954709 RepID=UPI0030FCDDB4